MQKFIHDNEQYVMEVKRKQGKTKIDRDINEYLRKKNMNNISLFNTNGNNSINNNNNNYNMQMLNNSLLMNYLLLQNQFLLQQNNQNMENQINSTILPQNNDETKGGEAENKINKNEEKGEEIDKNQENQFENGEEGKNSKENDQNSEQKCEKNGDRDNDNEGAEQKTEIIKKILEAISCQNNNNINIINEGKLTDHRKKGGK